MLIIFPAYSLTAVPTYYSLANSLLPFAGDRLKFPDSGTMFEVRFVEPVAMPSLKVKVPGRHDGEEQDALQLVMVLQENEQFLPKTIISRAMLVRRFKAELASALDVPQARIEVIDISRGESHETVEITLLLLPCNPDLEDRKHLRYPRALAASLAELIATSSPLLRDSATLRHAASIAVSVAYHDSSAHPDHPEADAPASQSVPPISSAPFPAIYVNAAGPPLFPQTRQSRLTEGGREPGLWGPAGGEGGREQTKVEIEAVGRFGGGEAGDAAGVHPLRTTEGRLGTFWEWGQLGLLDKVGEQLAFA